MHAQNVPRARTLSRHVLILDFDAATLIGFERLLEEAGFDTTTTWNMREAILLLEHKPFDLIVLGDHRPQIDAQTILRRLENLHRLVPCIVMRAQPDLRIHSRWSGLVTVLSGCTSSEVLENVRQRLGRLHSTSDFDESTSPPTDVDRKEPVLLRMMWGTDHAC